VILINLTDPRANFNPLSLGVSLDFPLAQHFVQMHDTTSLYTKYWVELYCSHLKAV
jgi:hypothetical protein